MSTTSQGKLDEFRVLRACIESPSLDYGSRADRAYAAAELRDLRERFTDHPLNPLPAPLPERTKEEYARMEVEFLAWLEANRREERHSH